MQYRMFWFDLANLLDLNLTLMQALNVIYSQLSATNDFDRGIKKIIEDVRGGLSFSKALSASSMFSDLEVCAVRSGETGGTMPLAMHYIVDGSIYSRADQYESFYQILSRLLFLGVPILQALKESSKRLDAPLREAAEKIHDSVKDGGSIAEAMSETGQFSAMEISLINANESGFSPDLLDLPADDDGIDSCETKCNLDYLLARLAQLSGRFNLK
jgi:type II secretory pathway component PulF